MYPVEPPPSDSGHDGSTRLTWPLAQSASTTTLAVHIALAVRRADLNLDAWLADIGLGQYAQLFHSNDIDGEMLSRLTADDLKDIGVTSVGHRKKMLDAISAISAVPAPLPPFAPTLSAAQQPSVPEHLAAKIRLSKDTLEGERKQVTVLFADLKAPWSSSPTAIPRRRASCSTPSSNA